MKPDINITLNQRVTETHRPLGLAPATLEKLRSARSRALNANARKAACRF